MRNGNAVSRMPVAWKIALPIAAGARFGPRRVAVLSATCGLALVAAASSGRSLGLAIALAGLSTGLTSPPLAVAVVRCFEDPEQAWANGAINAGTAAGIVLSGVAVLTFAGNWRELNALFAAIGVAVTVWLCIAVPSVAGEAASNGLSVHCLTREGARDLCASAFLTGVGSTAIWAFGGDVMREEIGFSDAWIALAWIALGAENKRGPYPFRRMQPKAFAQDKPVRSHRKDSHCRNFAPQGCS